jgi:MFS family permease
MATHVKVIAVLFAIFGAMLVAVAFAAPVLLGLIATFVSTDPDPDAAVAAGILGLTGVTLSIILAGLAIPFLATGWGMFKLKPWSRIAGIILAVLCLPQIPFGTIVGIYALVILFKKETEALFVAPA